MLEFDDIQYILLTRAPAITGRYEFLSFRNAAAGRAWLAAILETCIRSQEARASIEKDNRWVSVAFTWNGLRALGADEGSLASFPEEFKQGMVARAEVLGDTGDESSRQLGRRARQSGPPRHRHPLCPRRGGARAVPGGAPKTRRAVRRSGGALVIGSGGDAAIRLCARSLRLPRPAVPAGHRGIGGAADARIGRAAEGGRVHPRLSGRRRVRRPICRNPRFSPVTAATWPIAVCRSMSARFATFCARTGKRAEEQELLAAKLMGRWRSGAPLVLSPDKDDPALGADPQRNNDFNYKQMDPHGYAVPLGSHMRRMNPRDTAANMNRRRMIRRGGTYGPHLPEDAPEDGIERGIAAFVICASLIRQFEFAQNVWANDRNFHELGNERDPFIGNQDGTLEFKIPKRPIRKKITGLPAFTTVRGGAYFFLPGLRALRYLASLGDAR